MSEVPVCEIIEAALDNVKSLLKVVTPVTAENVVIPETVTTEDVNVKEPVRALIRIFPALPVDELEPEMNLLIPRLLLEPAEREAAAGVLCDTAEPALEDAPGTSQAKRAAEREGSAGGARGAQEGSGSAQRPEAARVAHHPRLSTGAMFSLPSGIGRSSTSV